MALFGKGPDCLHEYNHSVSIVQHNSPDPTCGRSAEDSFLAEAKSSFQGYRYIFSVNRAAISTVLSEEPVSTMMLTPVFNNCAQPAYTGYAVTKRRHEIAELSRYFIIEIKGSSPFYFVWHCSEKALIASMNITKGKTGAFGQGKFATGKGGKNTALGISGRS